MKRPVEVQGHRGARGLRPENTLVGFELAFDLGVTSVETDVHLTRDDVPVLFHDPCVGPGLCSLRPGASAPPPVTGPTVRSLTLAELRCYRVDRNPHPLRFPGQANEVSPLAEAFATEHGIDPLGIPTLAELFAFAAFYASKKQQPARLLFDLELKRVPLGPETIADGYDGSGPGVLERVVLRTIDEAGVTERARVRSFDHRCVMYVKRLDPRVQTAVLIAHTAPADPARLLADAGADVYCPDVRFVDADLVRRVHDAGKAVLPWTANEPEEWRRLVDARVDGVTTDYPDRLMEWLRGTRETAER